MLVSESFSGDKSTYGYIVADFSGRYNRFLKRILENVTGNNMQMKKPSVSHRNGWLFILDCYESVDSTSVIRGVPSINSMSMTYKTGIQSLLINDSAVVNKRLCYDKIVCPYSRVPMLMLEKNLPINLQYQFCLICSIQFDYHYIFK